MDNIYEAQSANKRKSLFVIAFFAVFIFLSIYIIGQAMLVYIGFEPGGLGYIGLLMIASGIITFISYYFSDKIVLGISGARPADRKRDFDFYTVAENLSIGAGLPKPKLYVIEDTATNAFATGRDPDHAVVCATRGLLEKLNRTQLEGVIAHELTHIRNYDMRLMSVVSVMVGTLALLANIMLRVRFTGRKDSGGAGAIIMMIGLVFALLSPVIAGMIKMAISRRREFLADTGSVALTKQPKGLIEALGIISKDPEALEVANNATAHLYISNPFKKGAKQVGNKFSNLFNTHPPVEERIKALEKML